MVIIMKNREEQLFNIVLSDLMSLPAYKLKNQYQKIEMQLEKRK